MRKKRSLAITTITPQSIPISTGPRSTRLLSSDVHVHSQVVQNPGHKTLYNTRHKTGQDTSQHCRVVRGRVPRPRLGSLCGVRWGCMMPGFGGGRLGLGCGCVRRRRWWWFWSSAGWLRWRRSGLWWRWSWLWRWWCRLWGWRSWLWRRWCRLRGRRSGFRGR